MSNRKADDRGEKALALFLDRHFYPEMVRMEGLVKTERVHDAGRQKTGIDIILRSDRGDTLTDEKAQLHFINDPLPTFSFEVSFVNEQGSVMDGWFVSESAVTQYYMLAWIDKARQEAVGRLVAEDFEKVTLMLISRRKILEHLAASGYGTQELKETAARMRSEGTERVMLTDDAYMVFSDERYDEKPVNVVMRRPLLKGLAFRQYEVDMNKVTTVD